MGPVFGGPKDEKTSNTESGRVSCVQEGIFNGGLPGLRFGLLGLKWSPFGLMGLNWSPCWSVGLLVSLVLLVSGTVLVYLGLSGLSGAVLVKLGCWSI